MPAKKKAAPKKKAPAKKPEAEEKPEVDDDPYADQIAERIEGSVEVELLSGAPFQVLTDREADFVRESVERYTADNLWQNISDLRDIDRMITVELLSWRWSQWLSMGVDYFGDPVSTDELSKRIKEHSTELRQLKKSLGVDRKSREASHGEDSVSAYLVTLRRRAKEFGIHRNQQATQAITSLQRIQGIITAYDNTIDHPREQKENKCTIEDVLEVIREELAKFGEIDNEFVNKVQTYWKKL